MIRAIIFALLLIPIASFAARAPKIPVYIYHLKPPLVINANDQSGLYYDIIKYLNQKITDYQFEIVYVPRKRINLMLERKQLKGMVLGVNPLWFKDKDENKHLWTARILTDRDEIVSLRETSIEYIDLNSLNGKVVGGVRGFYYQGINELVSKGSVTRVDSASELDLFDLLLAKRIDLAVISRSTFNYMIGRQKWHMYFHLSKKPHDIFDRRIMVPKTSREIFDVVAPVIDEMAYDQEWRKIEAQYQ